MNTIVPEDENVFITKQRAKLLLNIGETAGGYGLGPKVTASNFSFQQSKEFLWSSLPSPPSTGLMEYIITFTMNISKQ